MGLVGPQGPRHRDVDERAAAGGLSAAGLSAAAAGCRLCLGVSKHEPSVAVVGDGAHEAGRAGLRRVRAEPTVPIAPPM